MKPLPEFIGDGDPQGHPADPHSDFPVVLSTSGTVAAGGVWLPNTEALQNVYQQPIQIEEMRVLVANLNSGGTATNLNALLRVKITAGRNPLTNNFVPLQLFNPREQASFEQWQPTGGNAYSYMKWRLPVPMPLDMGMVFQPQFKWITPSGKIAATVAANSPLTIYVTLVGRRIAALPKKARVPYVTPYLSVVNTFNSLDQDLYNPFNQPLRVQRLVARVFSSSGDNDLWTSTPSVPSTAGGISVNTFRMQDQFGFSIVKDLTTWNTVFDPARGAWTFNRDLGARERWLITLANAPAVATYLPAVAIIGHREEEIR